MTEIDLISTELQKFSLSDAAIAEMEKQYMPLTVKGIGDKEGFKAVRTARLYVKEKRIEIEKTRKALKADALKFGQAVDGEAKRITAMLEPIETHLQDQEDVVKREEERIRQEEESRRQEKIQGRTKRLLALELLRFNGTGYEFGNFEIHSEHIAELSDDEFEAAFENFSRAVKKEKDRIAEEERLRREENERLEAERKRLEAIAQEQQRKEAALQAEQDKMEAEKRTIAEAKWKEEQEKKRLDELEQAKKDAAEKARIETEAKAKREAELKAEAERQAKEEAERQESLRPDKEKLIELAYEIETMMLPLLASAAAQTIAEGVRSRLNTVAAYIRKGAKEL